MSFTKNIFQAVRYVLLIVLLVTGGNLKAGTLNGTISLPTGTANNTINITVEVLLLNGTTLAVENFASDESQIAQGGSSTSYSINYPDATGNQVISVRYLCLTTSTCGDFVNEGYYTLNNGIEFEFTSNAVIQPASVPATINFVLNPGNQISGKVILPRTFSSRDIQTLPLIQFVPGQVNRLFRSAGQFSIIIPAGQTEGNFVIKGIPPIPGRQFTPFSLCETCEPALSRFAVVEGFSFDDPPATALLSGQNHSGVMLFHQLGAVTGTLPPIINFLLDDEEEPASE